MTKSIKSFRLSTRTQQQLSDLSEKFGASTAEIVTISVDHLYREEIRMDTRYDVSRREAIKRVGLDNVLKVESENCEPTNRLQDENNTTIEYKASIACKELGTGYDVILEAYYYPDESEFLDANGEPIEDLGNIDWEIDRYVIV
jgi:predicted DNA-binding protein